MKPAYRLYSVLRHITVWLIWFGLHSYTFFAGDFSKYSTADWLNQLFNCTSILLVFYAAAYCTAHLLYRYFFGESLLDDFSDFRNFFCIETVSILLIIVVYIALGVMVDTNYLGYKYPGIDVYIYPRLENILPYIVYAACYAFYRMNKKRSQKKIDAGPDEDMANELY